MIREVKWVNHGSQHNMVSAQWCSGSQQSWKSLAPTHCNINNTSSIYQTFCEWLWVQHFSCLIKKRHFPLSICLFGHIACTRSKAWIPICFPSTDIFEGIAGLVPQNLGISSTTFFPFTLHKTQELGSLAVEFLIQDSQCYWDLSFTTNISKGLGIIWYLRNSKQNHVLFTLFTGLNVVFNI